MIKHLYILSLRSSKYFKKKNFLLQLYTAHDVHDGNSYEIYLDVVSSLFIQVNDRGLILKRDEGYN